MRNMLIVYIQTFKIYFLPTTLDYVSTSLLTSQPRYSHGWGHHEHWGRTSHTSGPHPLVAPAPPVMTPKMCPDTAQWPLAKAVRGRARSPPAENHWLRHLRTVLSLRSFIYFSI